jgi:hypothetical protein
MRCSIAAGTLAGDDNAKPNSLSIGSAANNAIPPPITPAARCVAVEKKPPPDLRAVAAGEFPFSGFFGAAPDGDPVPDEPVVAEEPDDAPGEVVPVLSLAPEPDADGFELPLALVPDAGLVSGRGGNDDIADFTDPPVEPAAADDPLDVDAEPAGLIELAPELDDVPVAVVPEVESDFALSPLQSGEPLSEDVEADLLSLVGELLRTSVAFRSSSGFGIFDEATSSGLPPFDPAPCFLSTIPPYL